MAWIAGVATAGAALVGDIMSSQGQQQTNQMSTANMLQQEQWQTQMSNTAMQRRVADLKAAGLNPMLAVNTPGAQVGGVGMPSLQNPDQAFSGLGGQVGSAIQAQAAAAQVQQTKAQTDLIKAQTPGNVFAVNDDGTPDFTRATGGILGNLNAAQQMTQIQQGNALVSKIQADTAQSKSQTSINDVIAATQGINKGILEQTKNWLVQQAIAEAKIDTSQVSPAEAQAKIYNGPQGVWIAGIEKVLGALPFIHSGVSSYNKLQYPTTGH